MNYDNHVDPKKLSGGKSLSLQGEADSQDATLDQDMINQFSFWPRYDGREELPPNAAPELPNEVYTEESGVSLFTGRTALYLQDGKKERPPRSIMSAYSCWLIPVIFAAICWKERPSVAPSLAVK